MEEEVAEALDGDGNVVKTRRQVDPKVLFRPLSELILCITCLDLFLCNQFISLHSIVRLGHISRRGPAEPCRACPPTCPRRRTRFNQ